MRFLLVLVLAVVVIALIDARSPPATLPPIVTARPLPKKRDDPVSYQPETPDSNEESHNSGDSLDDRLQGETQAPLEA